MSDSAYRFVDTTVRRLAPLLTGLLAVLVDLLPLPNPAPETLAPLTTVCVIYFWTLYRPDLMSPLAVFIIGLVLDAVGGMPLGLTALSFLIVRSVLLTGQGFLMAQPFLVIWGCFVLVVVAAGAVRWLLASLWWGHLFSIEPALLETVLTVAIYPVVGWLLARVHQHLAIAPHAARS
jgi:rod shape-determining protein MreD